MPASPSNSRRGRAAVARLPFDQRLVLLQWMLEIFGASHFDDLAALLKDERLEGFDAENISLFHRELAHRLADRDSLSADVLLRYDQNIVRHWRRVTERRGRAGLPVYPKYFQYLALLFTEIYLDRYFGDADTLLASLNLRVAAFNAETAKIDQVAFFEPAELRKLAFWMATGSGKTLLMHVNILQFRDYLERAGRTRELNRVILLTPNEGLSRQHLGEFRASGMQAELFSKDGAGAFAGQMVEIIDIHKLKEDTGDRTVAVDAFEGNNLVLVDEGHRGAGGAEWMGKRNRLSERGFTFEYSATFGQAMKAANKPALVEEYARSILFDYSYRYFYRDGHGKDYQILNLEHDTEQEIRMLYLTACLLVFYQQVRLFGDQEKALRPFLLERPLWVFVGGSVNAVQTRGGRKVSDVVDILLFLAEFAHDAHESARRIDLLLRGTAGLNDQRGHELFQNAFAYLQQRGATADAIFADVLQRVFNAPAQGKLHVELLKGTEGELALRLGEHEPFGVINVGDATSLARLCEEHGELLVQEREFSGSLFHGLNDASTTINLLIGSRKFSEGWNSWRVSTMGLMNVGRSEGSEIIQLFGRGVRLKGHGFTLKRTQHLPGITRPRHIRLLETLNVFGVRASYMRQFREYLEYEGLPGNEDRQEITLPVLASLNGAKLRTIQLEEGLNFKKDGDRPTLGAVPDALVRHPVVIDWYPKIQADRSQGLQRAASEEAVKQVHPLSGKHLAFLDMDALHLEMVRLKTERGWHNMNLPRDAVRGLLEDASWYRLFIPAHLMEFTGFGRVRLWQEIATALLKKYVERYYSYRRQEWEAPHLQYRDLDPGRDDNFIAEYRFLVDGSQESIIATLEQLRKSIESGVRKDVELGAFHAIFFDRHLYQPLVHVASEFVEVHPVALNAGERDFVRDLRGFYQRNAGFFAGKELYLLRNQSRGKGIGFFEAGNFYPDFVLWLLVGNKQYISFVDPKGLRNTEGLDDPKIRLHAGIKKMEKTLGDPDVVLNSFIISQTPHQQIRWWDKKMSEADFNQRHVLFRNSDGDSTLGKLFDLVLAPEF